MAEHPDLVLRRYAPEHVQIQVILGCLLGDGALVGLPGERCLRISHREERLAYALWKHERLGPLAGAAPCRCRDRVSFETIAHPLFDDLAPLFYPRPEALKRVRRAAVLPLLRPLGLAVWMADLGRLELRADAFLPAQRLAVVS